MLECECIFEKSTRTRGLWCAEEVSCGGSQVFGDPRCRRRLSVGAPASGIAQDWCYLSVRKAQEAEWTMPPESNYV